MAYPKGRYNFCLSFLLAGRAVTYSSNVPFFDDEILALSTFRAATNHLSAWSGWDHIRSSLAPYVAVWLPFSDVGLQTYTRWFRTAGLQLMSWCIGWGPRFRLEIVLTSTSNIYKVVEIIHMLCMVIWVYPFIVMLVQAGDNFWKKLVRLILMSLLCIVCGCKPPLTASHILNIVCIHSGLATSYAVDWNMGAPLLCHACAGKGWCSFDNFWREIWSTNDIVVSWLMLQTHTNSIPGFWIFQ